MKEMTVTIDGEPTNCSGFLVRELREAIEGVLEEYARKGVKIKFRVAYTSKAGYVVEVSE